jgi:serine phosphatase RsbU (regulator of sigma subunit)
LPNEVEPGKAGSAGYVRATAVRGNLVVEERQQLEPGAVVRADGLIVLPGSGRAETAGMPDPLRLTAERLAELQRVNAELAELTGGHAVERVAEIILDRALDDVGALSRGLWLLQPDETFRLVRSTGVSERIADRYQGVALAAPLPLRDAVVRRRPVWCSSQDERDRRWPAMAGSASDEEIGSFAVLPLVVERRCLGAISLGYTGSHRFDQGERDHFTALAAQCAQAIDRARLHDAERAAARRLSLLAEAGRALGSSLELERTVEATLELAAALGEARALFLPELQPAELGRLRLAAASTACPNRRALLDELCSGTASLADDAAEVMLSGSPVVRGGSAGIPGPVMLVPLAAAERTAGVLAVAATPGAPLWPAEDLALAEELGRRAGVAIENARLFAERAEIADTLQRSLLPRELPTVPGLDLAARYAPAGRGLDVGGDFYDVFRVTHDDAPWDDPDRDAWAVMVGDVVGSGARAAAATAIVRHTARAVSPHLRRPGAVVDAVNRGLLEAGGVEQFCTLAYGQVRACSDGVTVELVNAGHPRPLVLRAGGTVEETTAEGALLGQFSGLRHEPVQVKLGPGDAIVLFTDGVLEARRPRPRVSAPGAGPLSLFGERRLAHVLAGVSGASAEGIAAAVADSVTAFTGGDSADDLAILVVRAEPLQTGLQPAEPSRVTIDREEG